MVDPRVQEAVPASELPALALDPNWADLDPENRHYLLIDLGSEDALSFAEQQQARAWLRSQPIPVVGTGISQHAAAAREAARPAPSGLAAAMDLLLSGDGELQRAVRNIEGAPVAASVLVQVLRAMPALNVLDGLMLESLAYATLQSGGEFAAWLRGREYAARIAVKDPVDSPVLLDRAGDCLRVVLNSADTRNALSVAMRDALAEAFKLVAMDQSIVQVQVSANGPCFSAGGELAEFGTRDDPAMAHRVRMLRNPARYLAPHSQRYHFHVHRACIGAGIELPAFAARLTATGNTFFQLPELGMGLIPGAGGCVSLCRRIGRQRTAYMAVLGKKISARRALDWGLIDAIVD